MTELSQERLIHPAIPRFDGFYDHWSMLMENLLQSKKCLGLIENGIMVDLGDHSYAGYNTRYLGCYVSQISEFFRKVKRTHLQTLRKEFEDLAMGEKETVDEYFARTLAIANMMNAHGEKLEHVAVVEKILRYMLVTFNYVVCSIEEFNDVTTISIYELQCSLLVHEEMMKGHKEFMEEQALKVFNVGRGRERSWGRGRIGGRQSKEYVECYNSHKLGHYQSEFPSWEESVS
ncbi:uncharacterized protein LOC131636068 [Vicia villosa]|uniref:uncharacterized protein LOC131636068 n=1 Tax=Vicia villosa TaxID=3911 RepID=UPI00273C05C8|nr:uncharacterized protein LOC131636068 [Vicia villosa]